MREAKSDASNSMHGMNSFALSDAVFLACMATAILVPRVGPVQDSSLFTGDLSRPFRQCVLLGACASMLRTLAFPDRRFAVNDCTGEHCSRFVSMLQFSWTMIEGLFLAFLRTCMPYLLQRQLATMINVVPGKSLQAWIFGVLAIDMLAVVLTTNVAPQWWALKKTGDVLLGIPIVRTVNMYRRVMKARDETASFVLLDSLISLEYCRVIVGLGAAIEYATDDRDPNKDLSQVWMTMRVSNIYVAYVCLLVHGLVLAVIDEGQLMTRTSSRPPPPASSSAPFTSEVHEVDELETALVSRDRST